MNIFDHTGYYDVLSYIYLQKSLYPFINKYYSLKEQKLKIKYILSTLSLFHTIVRVHMIVQYDT